MLHGMSNFYRQIDPGQRPLFSSENRKTPKKSTSLRDIDVIDISMLFFFLEYKTPRGTLVGNSNIDTL